MKLVREYINEKFTEDSDPIEDMGIGMIHKVEKWIKKINKESPGQSCDGIPAYDIVRGKIRTHGFTALPDHCGNLPDYIKFENVEDDFIISTCNMTTLRGCPSFVDGEFDCRYNELTSLKYAPKRINGNFKCNGNKVKFTEDDVRKVCKVKGNIWV